MGHIYYFNAYQMLPTIFQDGASVASQEAVGDAATYGLYPAPGIGDLLHIGLMKLPQIGYGLVVDLGGEECLGTGRREGASPNGTNSCRSCSTNSWEWPGRSRVVNQDWMRWASTKS